MAAINQKEYLKKYLGIGKTPGEKKKKKKKEKTVGNRLKIIDDDVDVQISKEIEDDIAAANEDAPQIVAVIDERPIALQVDEKTNSSLWKPIGEPSSTTTDIQTLKVNSFKFGKHQAKNSDSVKPNFKVKDESITRISNKTVYSKEYDMSPPGRRIDDNSPPRKRNRGDFDPSEIDTSPPRRNVDDNSPPRRRNRDGLSSKERDTSPPRRKVEDNSPPRRRNRDDLSSKERDTSPPRRKVEDNSPLRRRNREDLSSKDRHTSPPRIKIEDNSPPRRRTVEDSSPPRRRNRDDLTSKDRHTSPPRIKVEDNSPPRRRNRDDLSSSRDISPSRKHKATGRDGKKSRWDPEVVEPSSSKKMKKTLDGKQAGLQSAKELSKESVYIRQREDEVFRNMSAEVSGRNAATVVRAKKAKDLEEEAAKEKRERDMKEKYDRWGKGLKQVEDQSKRIEDQLHEMSKPLARYADDEDLEKFLKEQEREGDPMLNYIRKKKKKEQVAAGIPDKPMYKGEFMPNRFGIRPGYRWDGVDRSNGYEKKWFQVQNEKRASREEAFKWSTEDM